MGQTWPLFNLFSSFRTNITIFATNKSGKMSIQYMVLRFEPMAIQTWVFSHNHKTKAPWAICLSEWNDWYIRTFETTRFKDLFAWNHFSRTDYFFILNHILKGLCWNLFNLLIYLYQIYLHHLYYFHKPNIIYLYHIYLPISLACIFIIYLHHL